MQQSRRAVGNRLERWAMLDERLQLLTHIEDPRVLGEQHHNCSQMSLQMTSLIVVCVYHSRKKRQNAQ